MNHSTINIAASAAGTVLLWAATAPGQVAWYVDDDVCPQPGGGSQAQPFCQIQEAIAAADDGDTILVAPGVYIENLNYLGKAVAVESSAGAAVTTVQADLPDRVVRFSAGENPGSILDGFTITGGSGGIACAHSNPTIRNCIITGNTADSGAGINCFNSSPSITHCTIESNTAAYAGGGISCYFDSSPLISDCTISTNEGFDSGGGIACFENSSPLITRCTITHNATLGSGGGIASGDGSRPTIDGCTIAGNGASAGAGINCNDSSPTIRNSTISTNIADRNAGGIRCISNASPIIKNCIIQYNTGGSAGGGIVCFDSRNAVITGCTISNNRAVNGAGLYIAVYSTPILRRCDILNNIAGEFGGGVVCSGSDADFDECIFRGNKAESGAGIGCDDSSPDITNSIIRENAATLIGGGILCNDSRPTLANCVFVGNSAGWGGGAVYNYNFGEPTLINCTITGSTATRGSAVYAELNSHPRLENCIVWNNDRLAFHIVGTSSMAATYSLTRPVWPGDGNITGDPAFLGSDNFRFSSTSPCIDAGNNNYVPTHLTGDSDGAPRLADHPLIDDTGVGTPPIVDMGAYEYRDCNSNGVVDWADVANCTGEAWCADANANSVPDSCETPGDVDMDGRVDWKDVERLVGCMGGPGDGTVPAACRSFDFATVDLDLDGDVDLDDAGGVFNAFQGP